MSSSSDHSASRFKTTSWTLVGDACDNRADLETLLGRYWSPVFAYLRRKGLGRHDAEDMTQAFLSEVVLDRDLIGRADRSRGKFRSLLLSALNRFVIDEHRRLHGRNKKRPAIFVPDDPQAFSAAEPHEGDDPSRAFKRQWAVTVLSLALQRVEHACLRQGLERHWKAYEARIVRPAMHGGDPVPMADVASMVGVDGPEDVSSMLHTVKRKLMREMEDVVAETVEDASEIQTELKELGEYLSFSE